MNATKKKGRPRKPAVDDRIMPVIRAHYGFCDDEPLAGNLLIADLEKRSIDPFNLFRLMDRLTETLCVELSEDQFFSICDGGKRVTLEKLLQVYTVAKQRKE